MEHALVQQRALLRRACTSTSARKTLTHSQDASKGATPPSPDPLRRIEQLKALDRDHEDEESDQEHISGAVYYPHQGAASRGQSSVVGPVVPEQETAVPAVIGQVFAQQSLPVPKLSSGASPNSVEISLLSEDESQLLHGELSLSNSDSEPGIDEVVAAEQRDAFISDSEYGSGYDSGLLEDDETTPTATPTARALAAARRPSVDRHAGVHQHEGAFPATVELKPYNHQVGGHSTVYSFSRKAVCKQLNSKENEFYETIEQLHPELLEFLPRYVIATGPENAGPVSRAARYANTNNLDILAFSMSRTRSSPRRKRSRPPGTTLMASPAREQMTPIGLLCRPASQLLPTDLLKIPRPTTQES